MASPAAVLQVFVNANTKVASAQLQAFNAQLTGVGKTSAATGAGMGKFTKGAAAAGAGVAAFGVAAVVAGKQLYDLGAQFDEAYDRIRVGTGATGRELKRLEQSFRNVAKNVPNDFEEVGTAIADLNTRLGLTGKPLDRMAESILNLSRMTGTDLESNIKAVARSFVDWEVAIPNQTKALDGLFRISQASGASVAQIAEDIQKFGSPLRQLGFSFEEAAAMFANFERAGVNTQTMVPGLKLAISNLTRPTDQLAQTMTKLGIEAGKPDVALRRIFELLGSGSTLSRVDKIGLAMDVFGKRAGADMAEAISQGRFELDRFMRLMGRGETINKVARDTNDAAENFGIFANRLKVLAEPAARGVFNIISRLSKVLASPFVARALRAMGRVFKFTFEAISAAMRPMVRGVRGGFKVVSDVARAAAKVFRSIVSPIKSALSSVVSAVRDRFRKAQIAATNFVNSIISVINKIPGVEIGTISLGSGEGSSQRGRAAGFQRGGALKGGRASGDSIPAMLERGEYVLNREAVKKIGVQRLNQLNFKQAPRFQTGGYIDTLTELPGRAIKPVADVATNALDLLMNGAGQFLKLLPKPNLPEPITGLGPYLLSIAREFIKKNATSPLKDNAWVDSNTFAVARFLASKFNASISSSYRSPAQNAAVGGVPNSSHTRGTPSNPGAFDFVPPSSGMQSFAGKNIAGIVENMIHDVGSGLHNHIAFFQRGGAVGARRGRQRDGWVKTGYTVFDDGGGGYLGHLQQGRGYAELGTATQGGVATGRGYIAQALGMSGELRDKFPLDVMINGKKRKMFKRDRGYGQGTPAYSIDIYRDSWPFFGIGRNSKGSAFIRKSATQEQIKKVKEAAREVIASIRKARRAGGLEGFLDAARKNADRGLRLADDGELERARDRLAKARKQIRKALKRRPSKPSPPGTPAPAPDTPSLPGMPGGSTLEALRRAVAFLEEDVQLFDEQAGLDWSLDGSELHPSERSTLIAKNQALLAKLVELRDKVIGTINFWTQRVPDLRGKVKTAEKKIKDLKKKIKGSKNEKQIGKWQKQIKGHQKDIKGWKRGIETGTGLLNSLPSELDDLQGVTGRGGKIQQVQMVLETLGRPTAVSAAEGTDSEIADLLRQQLAESQSALAITQAQMPIFQQFMPKFHQGGIVQGPMGAERPVMAQAGEGIFTRDQMNAMGAGNITVVIEDAAIDSSRIRVEVDGVIQDKISTVRRQGSNRRFATK